MLKQLRLTLLFLLSILVFPAIGQDAEDEFCALTPQHKKVKKLYEDLYDRNITDRERFQILKEAIQKDEGCAVCYYDYARLAYYSAQKSGRGYEKALDYYLKAIEACPIIHSDAYFDAARIYEYLEQREDAIIYFRHFLEFNEEDNKRYANNYAKKKRYAESAIEDLKFWKEYYENEVPFDPKPLENVSTRRDEYLPMLSPDNKILYFTRKVEGNQRNNITTSTVWIEMLTQSQRENIDGLFDKGEGVNKTFQDASFENLGGVTISVDNHEMIICGCKMQDVEYNGKTQRIKNCDLYRTGYEKVYNERAKEYEFKWTTLENLGDHINGDLSWEGTPTLSGDGQTLYFAKQNPDPQSGRVDMDLYYSTRRKDGSWTAAKRMPDIINTEGDEKSPYMHADSKTLYYVSGPCSNCEYYQMEYDRTRGGLPIVGGFDIYYTRQKDDGSWSEPKLLAYPINSDADEVGIIVSTDGKKAYFSSNRVSGAQGMDIFSFDFEDKEARPDKVVLISGDVKNEDGSPVEDAVVEIKKQGSDEKQEVKVNEDGSYAAVVNMDREDEIVVVAKKPGFTFGTKLVSPKEAKSVYVDQGTKFEIQEVKKGTEFTVDDINYPTASYELTPEAKFVLDQAVDFLKFNPDVKIEIQGHTDDEGRNETNQELSENRAKGVYDYLVAKGIDKSRLSYKGYGEAKPKVPNTSDANRAINRRTDFKILDL